MRVLRRRWNGYDLGNLVLDERHVGIVGPRALFCRGTNLTPTEVDDEARHDKGRDAEQQRRAVWCCGVP